LLCSLLWFSSHWSLLVSDSYPHFHLRKASAFRVGLPLGFFIGPLTPPIRAQKDFFRAPPWGCGALRLDPVALLYLSRPALVRPPVRDLCLPIRRETLFDFLFLAITSYV